MLQKTKELGAKQFRLQECLQRVAHWLPSQGPIQDFIHHNTLHAFQNLNFHEGLRRAARLYGAASYMSFAFYQQAYREGRIRSSAIARVLGENIADGKERDFVFQKMISMQGTVPPRRKGVRATGLQSLWTKKFGVNLDSQVHPVLFKLAGNYLDQGIAIWQMPGSQTSFYECVRALVFESFLPLDVLSTAECKQLLTLSPEQAILSCLEQLVGQESHFEAYLLELHLGHPGWSGLIGELQANPQNHRVTRKISLQDFTAIELLLQLGWAKKKLGSALQPLVKAGAPEPDFVFESQAVPTEEETLLAYWHEAFEWSYYEDLLEGILSVPAAAQPTLDTTKPLAQALFCLDDRESSVRRYLEGEFLVETFGTAGFFGLDFFFQGAGDALPYKHCPLPINPKHLVRERAHSKVKKAKKNFHFNPNTNTFIRGWLITQTLGIWAALKLAISIFKPSLSHANASALTRIDDFGEMILKRDQEAHKEGEFFEGYTLIEMADRVEGLIRSIGMEKFIAKLVVLFAHGSSSVNNPYFAAYDCGACSGKPGSPNSRAFALMANDKSVRELLESRGISIPEDTWFVGAIHDTARDEVRYFDLALLPQTHAKLFEQFEKSMQRALEKNAKERCRRFHLVPKKISLRNALKEVRRRSVAIFEPRPEYNHATNAACFVGRRDLIKKLFMDRRVFLNSYNPASDGDGKTLEQILSAVVPVCGGINMEYFFSRLDPLVYGADSKLPHNVIGLLGVINGVEGDLLTGLPTQMTEVHDPVRLMLVLDQEPDVALAAIQAKPTILEWFANDWMKAVCISPTTQKPYLFKDRAFKPLELDLRKPVPVAVSALQLIQGKEDNIPVHRLAADKKSAGAL